MVPTTSDPAVGAVLGLGSRFAFAGRHDFSVRLIGSTSLSVLEVARGRMDAFVVRTKMWNFYWARPLVLSSRIALRVFVGDRLELVDFEKVAQTPEDSWTIVCEGAMPRIPRESLEEICASQ